MAGSLRRRSNAPAGLAAVAIHPQSFHILGITGQPSTTYVYCGAKEAAEVMIRVARVWAHRSPSGPSFRRQLPRTGAGAEAPVPLRSGGVVLIVPLGGEGSPQPARLFEERHASQLP